jgi:hypothetical protein
MGTDASAKPRRVWKKWQLYLVLLSVPALCALAGFAAGRGNCSSSGASGHHGGHCGHARDALSVVFAIDGTGSMGDEIEVRSARAACAVCGALMALVRGAQNVKTNIVAQLARLRARHPGTDISVGAAVYRDKGDTTPLHLIPPTLDLGVFEDKLRALRAEGGHDYEEHVALGLNGALTMLIEQTARLKERYCGVKGVVFLMGDAGTQQQQQQQQQQRQQALLAGHSLTNRASGSHKEYRDFTVINELQRAKVVRGTAAVHVRGARGWPHTTRGACLQAGIPINVVGCSGLNEPSVAEFKEIASATGGTFSDLTYQQTAVDKNTGARKTVRAHARDLANA